MDANKQRYILGENQLIWSGQDLTSIPDLQEGSQINPSSISYLDISYNKISCFEGLHLYSSLDILILDGNRISDFQGFPMCLNLTTLSLNKNMVKDLTLNYKIQDLDQLLEVLKKRAPALRYLSLLGNSACPHQILNQEYDDDDYRRYRYYVTYCLPSLKFLDSTPVTRHERLEAKQRGMFLKVIKSSSMQREINARVSSDPPRDTNRQFIPLPISKVNLNSHKGIYGACRYRYTGKHSEGNRFIRNIDL